MDLLWRFVRFLSGWRKEEDLIVPYKDIYVASLVVPFLPAVEALNIRDDDVFIVTYPKCGTTWMQAIVWLIMNELDTTWKGQNLEDLVPMIEYPTRMGTMGNPDKVDWEASASPRIFKTHIPLHLLNKDILERKKRPKIIYVTRNPKDTLVSFFYFETGFKMPPWINARHSTFEEFFQRFIHGICQFGDYWEHNKEAWNCRDWDNVLFMHYEGMLKDPFGHVQKVGEFLGKQLTDDHVNTVVKETAFNSMKGNDKLNYSYADKECRDKDSTTFFRKGKVGDWRNHLTVAMSETLDKVNEERFKETGLVHDFGN